MRQCEQRTRDLGVKLTVYVTMGEYDEEVVWGAHDDATLARVLLALSAEGNVRTKTLKAFSREELEQILR